MLRINKLQSPEGITLRLEGKLLKEWVDELHGTYSEAAGQGNVRLDLRDLTYVDWEGRAALQSLMKRGVEVVACSSFMSEMLGGVHHV